MAVSLFRRWRSQKFRDLVGQESVVSTLQNVLKSGNPARAYLFCGPRGTGKTSSARIFAKAINCEKGPAAEPCGECHQCLSIAEGNNLDVFEIDAASHTQVDKIRDFIVEKVHFTPVSARHKVYIIDEVHKLSTSSFNALLKTLEEPPAHVVFILATTHPHEMPATILSRCQRYDFRPLTAGETEKHLLMIAAAEGLQVDDDAARQLARAADGSLRDALVLFEQAVVFSAGKVVTREKVLDLLGGVGYEVLEEMFLDLLNARSAGALRRLDDWISRGRDLKRLAESFQEHLRMMLLLKVKTEDQSIRHLASEERESLERLCEALTVSAITSWLRQVMELLAAVRQGHAARLEWEMLLLSCAQPEVNPSLQGLERRLERLEAGGPAASLPTAATASEPSVADPRLLARLEALEAGEGQAHDPRLWDKLARLEAEVEAWKDRFLSNAPILEEPDAGEDTAGPPLFVPPLEVVTTTLEPAETHLKGRESSNGAVSPGVAPPNGVLARDVVDDWLVMPPLLINAEDFRRELPLFTSYSAAPDVEPEPPVEVGISEGLVEVEVDVEPQVDPEEVVALEIDIAEPSPAPSPFLEPDDEPGVAAPAPIDLKDFWRRLMQGVKEQDIRLHAVLADARLASVEQARFEIALPPGYDWHMDKLLEGRKMLEAVASRVSGATLSMECTLGGEKASPPKDSEHADMVARAAGVFGGASIVE